VRRRLSGEPIADQTWDRIQAEFGLPTLEQVSRRLSELHEDPDIVMQQLVRVIDEGTYCPGFQFTPALSLRPAVVALFRRAMELRIPHNYFTAWMITPSSDAKGARPVDLLDSPIQPLMKLLEESAS
jgi:hypothetical protein